MRAKLIGASALLAICVSAQQDRLRLTEVHNIKATAFVISDNNGKMVLSVDMKGEVAFGEGVKPSEATRVFVAELKKLGLEAFPCAEQPTTRRP